MEPVPGSVRCPDPATVRRVRADWPDPERTPLATQRVALVDLLDRVLAGGVVISGELTLGIADVDLVRISLRALIASVSTALPPVE